MELNNCTPKRIAWLVCVLLATPCLAQGNPQVDFSIELVDDIPFRTPLDSEGSFRFIVTNHNPDAGAAPTLFHAYVRPPIPFISGKGEALFFFSSEDPDSECYIEWAIGDPLPGVPLYISFGTDLNILAPGESFVCEVQYWVNPNFDFVGDERIDEGRLSVEWRVSTLNIEDPNPANNSIYLDFVFFAPEIPTLSSTGITLFAVVLCISAVVLQRRTRKLHRLP